MEKKNVLIHFEWLELFEETELTDEEQMELLFHAVKYAKNGLNPTFSDRTLKAVWATIKRRIDADFEKYRDKCEINRANGSKGGRPKKEEEEKTEKPNGYSGFSAKTQQNPEKPDMDTDMDTDIDMDIESEPDIEAVKDYFKARNYISSSQTFFSYYSAKGWKLKGEKIKNWRKLADLWESREKDLKQKPPDKKKDVFSDYSQRDYSAEEWRRIEQRMSEA